MKFAILILLLVGLSMSCKTAIKTDDIYGSWKTIVNPKDQNSVLSDSVVFMRPNSLRIYTLSHGEIVDSIFATFHVNEKNMELTTKYGTTQFRFAIIELSNTSLVTKELGKNIMAKYKRLK